MAEKPEAWESSIGPVKLPPRSDANRNLRNLCNLRIIKIFAPSVVDPADRVICAFHLNSCQFAAGRAEGLAGAGIHSRLALPEDGALALVVAMRYLTLSALASFLLAGAGFGQTTTGQHPAEFRGTVTRSVQMKYLLFLPDDYRDNGSKKWPLIMYLHGGSRRGDNIESLKDPGFGLPALLEKKKSFPFIVVSPLCPNGEFWTDTTALIALLDKIEKEYGVDLSRVYLTGHSMGGFGTWYLAYQYPDRFAAIAPMSAPFVVTAWADRLKTMPIWAFHGRDDELAPIGAHKDLIDALRALGNQVRFTVLPGRDHFILDTYEKEELYSWFLKHSLSVRTDQ